MDNDYNEMGMTNHHSGSKRKVWKYLGIGCGVVMLIFAVLLTAGAFKAVSCCNQVVDYGKQTEQAVVKAKNFGRLLYNEKLDDAYAMTSGSYQSQVNQQRFRQGLEPYLPDITQSTPFLLNLDMKFDESIVQSDKERTWSVVIGFAEADSQEVVAVGVTITPSQNNSDAEPFDLAVEGVVRRPRDMRQEAAGREVLALHEQLINGHYKAVLRQLRKESNDESVDQQLLLEIQSLGEMLRHNESEIKAIEYRDQSSARIRVQVADYQLNYELIPVMSGLSWRVRAMPEMVEITTSINDEEAPR